MVLVGLGYLCGFTLLAIGVTALVWKFASRAILMPYALYCGFYVLTTGLGGVIAALTDGEILEQLDWGLDVAVLGHLNTLTYWGLLYAPLLIPGLTIVLLQDFRLVEGSIEGPLSRFQDHLDCSTLLLTFFLFAGFCFGKLALQGQLGSILMWFTLKSDFLSMMVLREELMNSLGSVFFGLAYITLPVLSFCAFYRWNQTRGLAWGLSFGLMALVNVLLSMALMQKSPVLIFMVFVGIAAVEMKLVRWQALGGVLIFLVMTLTALQSFMLEDWDHFRSLNLLAFRMAASYPYYVSIYPDVLPYGGIDLGQHLVGIGEGVRDNYDVFEYMYPTVKWVQGAAPGPAHVRAYSQGGVPYAAMTMVVLGLFLKGIGTLRERINGPISFAFYMGSLVFLYYVTQTSMREAILSCYGIFWTATGVAPLVLFNHTPPQPRTVHPAPRIPRMANTRGSLPARPSVRMRTMN